MFSCSIGWSDICSNFFSIFENEHYAADQLYVFLWVQFQQIGKFGCARDKVLIYKKITNKFEQKLFLPILGKRSNFQRPKANLKNNIKM